LPSLSGMGEENHTFCLLEAESLILYHPSLKAIVSKKEILPSE
jgi:hypothetical protein